MSEFLPPPNINGQGGYFTLEELINGIIHNLNNPLTILKVRTQLLLTKFPQNHALQTMMENIGRIESILTNIATKLREEQNESIRPLNLNTLINIELNYLEGHLFFKHHVQKTVYLQDNLPFLRGVYRHLSQGFLAQIAASLLNMSSSKSRHLTISTSSLGKDIFLEVSDSGNLLTSHNISTFCLALQDQSQISDLPEQIRPLAQILQEVKNLFGPSCREQVITALQPVGTHYRYVFSIQE